MGIQGMHKFVSGSTSTKELSEYHGKKVGVDVLGWIYRGGMKGCVSQFEGRGNHHALCYVLEKAHVLVSCGIYPIFVFDGAHVPAKSETYCKRNSLRMEAANKAKALKGLSVSLPPSATKDYQSLCRSAFVATAELISRVMNALRSAGFTVIVSPYEADSQLGYMSRTNEIFAVISEDCDILVYGCRRLLTKLNFNTLQTTEIDRDAVFAMYNMQDWSFEKFVDLAILSGCEYGAKLPGIGIKKAHSLLQTLSGLEAIKLYAMKRGSDEILHVCRFLKAKAVFCKSWVFTRRGDCLRIDGSKGMDYLNAYTGEPVPGAIRKSVMNGFWDRVQGRYHGDVPYIRKEKESIEKWIRDSDILKHRLSSLLCIEDYIFIE
jgi:exonuclease 1